MRSMVVTTAVLALLAACATQDKSSTSDTGKAGAAAGAAATPTKLGETSGLETPESVRYDPELDVYYVSNINGNPGQKDGNGFIAVIRADSTGAAIKKLVEGGKNGAKLDAPKGLALV